MRLGSLVPGAIPDTIVDLLSIDGGWWTVTDLAERINRPRDSVSKALLRLHARDLVTRRTRWHLCANERVMPVSIWKAP